ncbi:MAG: hypothetical protein ACYDH3_10685 [Candidatus Aminicenantales bacterium]
MREDRRKSLYLYIINAPLIIPVGTLTLKWLGLQFPHHQRLFFKV